MLKLRWIAGCLLRISKIPKFSTDLEHSMEKHSLRSKFFIRRLVIKLLVHRFSASTFLYFFSRLIGQFLSNVDGLQKPGQLLKYLKRSKMADHSQKCRSN